MSEIFKFQSPRPMSDVTIQLEKDIANSPTLAQLHKLKAKNRFRIAGSLKLDEAYKAKEAELSKRKPDLSITYPTKDRFPCDDEQVEHPTDNISF